ncbi:MAG: MBL fold metallo-hydrolase, partial [Myxococcales bacterium]|nr:MBL fold metallo-hydrolase [Myxococcales bacterium]
MRLRFLGASGEVTGSCYLLETRRARVLIDFGAFQGGDASEARNRQFPSAIEPGRLDAVLLTHAHIDHTGRLPLLAQHEFARPIYATPATIDLAAILLRDAAYLQRMDAQRESRKRVARGEPPVRPLFDGNDVDDVLPLLRPVEYQTPTEVAPGVEATWVDAGHIL